MTPVFHTSKLIHKDKHAYILRKHAQISKVNNKYLLRSWFDVNANLWRMKCKTSLIGNFVKEKTKNTRSMKILLETTNVLLKGIFYVYYPLQREEASTT